MKKEGLNLALLSVLVAVVTIVILIACILSASEIMALGYCCKRWFAIKESNTRTPPLMLCPAADRARCSGSRRV